MGVARWMAAVLVAIDFMGVIVARLATKDVARKRCCCAHCDALAGGSSHNGLKMISTQAVR